MSALVCAVLFVGLVLLGQTEVPLTSWLAPVMGWFALIGAAATFVLAVVFLAVGS